MRCGITVSSEVSVRAGEVLVSPVGSGPFWGESHLCDEGDKLSAVMGNRCPHSLNTSCNPMRIFAQRHSSQVTACWPGSGVPLGPGSLGPPGSCSLGRAGLLRTHTPDLS